MRARTAPRSRLLRMAHATVAQRRRSIRFDVPALPDGHRSLVTGGNKGIGAAVAEALRGAGSTVVVAARQVEDDVAGGGLHLDLGDLDQVAAAAPRLVEGLGGGTLDLLVANAGIAPTSITTSAQGHESAYAVNVAGHHLLIELLQAGGALADGARVVIVTGDILVLASDCTPTFRSTRRGAGTVAYARSKLGSLWLSQELAARHPELSVTAVHPGVVRSGLVDAGPTALLADRIRITPELSAQAVLAAAFDGQVATGGYVHNTLGLLTLRPDDRAADAARSARFVAELDELIAPWR